jgi:hypothetical protein
LRAWACTRGQSRLAAVINSSSRLSDCYLVFEELLERTHSGLNSWLGTGDHTYTLGSPARVEDCHRMGRSVKAAASFIVSKQKYQSTSADTHQDGARLLPSLSAKARHPYSSFLLILFPPRCSFNRYGAINQQTKPSRFGRQQAGRSCAPSVIEREELQVRLQLGPS